MGNFYLIFLWFRLLLVLLQS